MIGNWLKTGLLMAGILALFGAIGGVIGGQQGMLVALAIGGAMNFFAYWFSDKMVLAMYRAQEADETSAPQLYRMVRELAARAGLPMPRVYLIDQAQPNAFATGRNPEHAAVAATTGLLRLLTPRELRGVMAHELAHVKHREGGGNPLLAILVLILAPIAAMLIQFAISRTREFGADRRGADISGDPRALADALAKIEAHARGIPNPTAEAHPATAQMMIVNPLSGGGIRGLFSTHPATAERIARLHAMA